MLKMRIFVLCFSIVISLILACSCGNTPSARADSKQHTDNTHTEKPDSSIADVDKNFNDEVDSLPSNESDTIPADDSTSDSTEESEEDDSQSKIPMEKFYTFGTFNGGVVWVGDVVHQYLVDTTGKALLDIDGYPELTDFSDGYSHVQIPGRILTIDTSGNITADLTLGENEKIVMVNGGYVFTREYVADFDSSGFNYKIYGPDGNIIREFYSDEIQYLSHVRRINVGLDTSEWDSDFKAAYCRYAGKGRIKILQDGNYNLYYINSGTTAPINRYGYYLSLGINEDLKFGEEFYTYLGKAWASKDDSSIRLVFMNIASEITSIVLPFEIYKTDVDLSDISEGYCVFRKKYYDEDTDMNRYRLVTIDLDNATYNIISTEFDDKIGGKPEMCHKNIVISMTGKDGENYYAVVDVNGNTILPPQKGWYDPKCVYNEDATPIFDVEEKGFPENCIITKLNEGIVLVSDIDWTKVNYARYADEEGNVLFDSVDVSGAKVISLETDSN